MGVNSLWDIVGPAARPVKLEALSRKKLAVDASIWIYQFLKAVRDKDGNSLGQTHIVGFFRRICKLLYFGILPLFVFDGGAPPLKRQTIQKRKDRRQGNQDNATTTAQKLLAIQVQRQAHEAGKAAKRTKAKKAKSATPNPDEGVYLEDLPVLHPEHGVSLSKSPEPVEIHSSPEKRFVKRDEYHLPELKQFTVLKADTRIMPASEFQEFADDATFDVVDGIDIDSVDPASEEFKELPLATQYMILSHLRLRSRLRLGYSKTQLEELFPDGKDFSKFQIQQVQKRNFYTQRLMNVSGMDDSSGNATRRIAGDKDKHYALINTGDGWTLSLQNEDSSQPVVLDENGEVIQLKEPLDEPIKEEGEKDSDDELEDVPLGGSDDDNEELNKAVIESIYDQYKSDYETDKQHLEEFDAVELKEAIELSKKDYMELKNEEQEVRQKIAQATSGNLGFSFDQSILFGEQTKPEFKEPNRRQPEQRKLEDDEKRTKSALPRTTGQLETNKAIEATSGTKQSKRTPHEKHEANMQKDDLKQIDLTEGNGKDDLKDDKVNWEEIENLSDDHDRQLEQIRQPSPPKDIPMWFSAEASGFHNPHAVNEFYNESNAKVRPKNDNEEAGIISWTEAQELLEEPDSDIEEIANQEMQGGSSDVEEIAELLQPSSLKFAKSDHGDVELTPGASIHETVNSAEAQNEQDASPSQNKRAIGVTSKAKVNAPASKRKTATFLDYDFEEQDEEQLVRQLRDEEEHHAEFAYQIKADHQLPSSVSVTEEQLLQERLQKAKRDSDEVSETMISDVQELLKRFGIPFITAPMEAEAQCAELYRMGLVDGIVTDDSDCFLFGGSRIYKNMFNQKQYVECYIAEDIQHIVGLDRDRLIELALLLGSDYTEGIKGVGPVLAMEILAEFKNLERFKKWFDDQTQRQHSANEERTSLEKNLLNRIKNGKLFLPENFPDAIVKDAYTHADVDKDDSEFKWGVPSLDQIRTFLMYNVGWSQGKVDEVMIPLIRDMNRKRAEGTQSKIGEFFPQEYISYKKEVNLGKRMKVAASKLKK